MNPEHFFTKEQKEQLRKATAEAENMTSGEIRIHIEDSLKGDVLDRAAYIFRKLNMHKTQLRNGVLIYLALKTRQFAIIGDSGIHSRVPVDFWDKIKDRMEASFREGDFLNGLKNAVSSAGEQLKAHFPRQTGDVNELKDDVSFGKS